MPRWLESKFGGQALEATAAVLPVEGGRVSSGFGIRRSRRRPHRRRLHAGLDVAAPMGTAVLAARGGVVYHVTYDEDREPGFGGYGTAVVLYHPDDDRFSFYAHLSEVGVRVGDALLPGQKLGRVGNTTNGKFHGMAPHLHFEVRERAPSGRPPFPGPYGAYAIDPYDWLVDYGYERSEPDDSAGDDEVEAHEHYAK